MGSRCREGWVALIFLLPSLSCIELGRCFLIGHQHNTLIFTSSPPSCHSCLVNSLIPLMEHPNHGCLASSIQSSSVPANTVGGSSAGTLSYFLQHWLVIVTSHWWTQPVYIPTLVQGERWERRMRYVRLTSQVYLYFARHIVGRDYTVGIIWKTLPYKPWFYYLFLQTLWLSDAADPEVTVL